MKQMKQQMTFGPLPILPPDPGYYMACMRPGGKPVEVEVRPWHVDSSVTMVVGCCLWRDAHRIFSSWQRSGLYPPLGKGPAADAFRRLVVKKRRDARIKDGREPRVSYGKYRVEVDPYRLELNKEYLSDTRLECIAIREEDRHSEERL